MSTLSRESICVKSVKNVKNAKPKLVTLLPDICPFLTLRWTSVNTGGDRVREPLWGSEAGSAWLEWHCNGHQRERERAQWSRFGGTKASEWGGGRQHDLTLLRQMAATHCQQFWYCMNNWYWYLHCNCYMYCKWYFVKWQLKYCMNNWYWRLHCNW